MNTYGISRWTIFVILTTHFFASIQQHNIIFWQRILLKLPIKIYFLHCIYRFFGLTWQKSWHSSSTEKNPLLLEQRNSREYCRKVASWRWYQQVSYQNSKASLMIKQYLFQLLPYRIPRVYPMLPRRSSLVQLLPSQSGWRRSSIVWSIPRRI